MKCVTIQDTIMKGEIKMNKKLIAILLVLVFVMVPLTACNNGGGSATPPPAPASPSSPAPGAPAPAQPGEQGGNTYSTFTWPDIIPVYSVAGGTAFLVNSAFVDLAARFMPGVTFVAEGATGTFEMMNLLVEQAGRNRAALAFAAADGVYMSRLGLGLYEEPLTDVYYGTWLTRSELWLTTPRSSGIKTMYDVKGKRVAVGGFGSSIAVLTEVYLNAHDVTLDDFSPSYVSYEGANDGMQDGSLDGGFYGGPPPFAPFEEIAGSGDIIAIGVTQDIVDKILAQYPYYGTTVLTPDMMSGLDGDTLVLGLMTAMNVNSALSDELMYAILEMIFDNLEEFQAYVPRALRDLSLETWDSALHSEIHPGSIKFFTERGAYNR